HPGACRAGRLAAWRTQRRRGPHPGSDAAAGKPGARLPEAAARRRETRMNAIANVISAELMKVFSKRRTYVLAGLYWVLMPIVLLLVGRVILSSLGGSFLEDEGLAVGSLLHNIASPFGMARLAVVGPAYMNPSFY